MREMKDSGVAWIGEIPKDWEATATKRLFDIESGATPKSENAEYFDGDIAWITPADYKTEDVFVSHGRRNLSQMGYDSCSTTLIPAGSLIFSKRAPIGAVAINSNPLCTNQGCLSCIPLTDDITKFYYYVMSVSTEQYNLLGSGTTFKEISATNFANFILPKPPLAEQGRIAEVLDAACSKVDALIANQSAQIEKLRAYRQSLITETVTKGLDPEAPMKHSGVEWIGDIPEGWEINRGKFVLNLLSRPVEDTDEVITCFRDGEVTLRKLRREEGFTFSDKEIGYQGIEPGDIVVHGMDGFAGAIGISDSRGKGSPVLIVCDSRHNKEYLVYYLRSLAFRNIFTALATGIRVRSCDLRWNKLSVLPFVLPPLSEQSAIADYLDAQCAKIDALIALKQQKIDRLGQYKKSLIYEYVTGKKEA